VTVDESGRSWHSPVHLTREEGCDGEEVWPVLWEAKLLFAPDWTDAAIVTAKYEELLGCESGWLRGRMRK